MQEEKKVIYSEGIYSSVKHCGYHFLKDVLFLLADKKPIQCFPIEALGWVFDEDDVYANMDRMKVVNTVYPVIVMKAPNPRKARMRPNCAIDEYGLDVGFDWVVLDGIQRLAKAALADRTKIYTRVLTLEEIHTAHMKPFTELGLPY